MAYTTQQAIETLNGYLSINENDKKYIDDTKKRGFVLELSSGERIVIFVYPLVHKQDNTKIILIQEIVVLMNAELRGNMHRKKE